MLEELDFIAHWLVFLLCTSSSFYMRVCRVRACVARAHCSMQASMLCGAQNSFVLKRLVYILKLKIGWLATTTRPWASSARFKRKSAQRRQMSIQEDLWRFLLYLPALSFLLCHNFFNSVFESSIHNTKVFWKGSINHQSNFLHL